MAERSPGERFFAAMETELNKERAAVLGRYGRRIDAAIARCEALLADVEAGNEAAIAKYRDERRAALQAMDDLCLQREMIGVLDHSWLQRAYTVPPKH